MHSRFQRFFFSFEFAQTKNIDQNIQKCESQ